MLVDIHVNDASEPGLDIALPTQYAPYWTRDVRRRKGGRGDLVEKWLEQVEIPFVDQRDLNWRPGEGARTVETRESAPDNDDPRRLRQREEIPTGTEITWPALMLEPARSLSSLSVSTLVPYRRAISHSESPRFTR